MEDNRGFSITDCREIAKAIFQALEVVQSPLLELKHQIEVIEKDMSSYGVNDVLFELYHLVVKDGRYDTVGKYLEINYGFETPPINGEIRKPNYMLPSYAVGKNRKVREFKLGGIDLRDDSSKRVSLDAIVNYCLTHCYDYNSELKPIYHMLEKLMGDSKDEVWLEDKRKIEKRISDLQNPHSTVIQRADEVNIEKNVNNEIWK